MIITVLVLVFTVLFTVTGQILFYLFTQRQKHRVRVKGTTRRTKCKNVKCKEIK